jgi:hypothetical protein
LFIANSSQIQRGTRFVTHFEIPGFQKSSNSDRVRYIFRDAKQFTGLGDAQTRDPKKLDFHFNASLSALNLAKLDDQQRRTQTSTEPAAAPFSMASYKRAAFNDHLLQRFISQLDLDPTSIQSHPNYQNLRSYGIISI